MKFRKKNLSAFFNLKHIFFQEINGLNSPCPGFYVSVLRQVWTDCMSWWSWSPTGLDPSPYLSLCPTWSWLLDLNISSILRCATQPLTSRLGFDICIISSGSVITTMICTNLIILLLAFWIDNYLFATYVMLHLL